VAAARDLAVFYRSLVQLLGTGVIGSEALRGCAAILPEAATAADRLERGEPLSSALAGFPDIFSREHLYLISLGEQCGCLEVVLSELADYTEQAEKARLSVRNGLAMPAMMLLIAAFVLPLPTLILGGSLVGYLGSAFGFIFLLLAIVYLAKLFYHSAPTSVSDSLIRRIPVARTVLSELDLWRVSSCIRMFLRTSVGMPESMRFAADICRGPDRAKALRAAADAVEKRGVPASPILRASGVFPVEMMTFWENGENSGQLDRAFDQIAARSAERFTGSLKTLSTVLPWIGYGLACAYLIVQIMRAASAYTGYLNQG
jgi:general secretion pathway protein F